MTTTTEDRITIELDIVTEDFAGSLERALEDLFDAAFADMGPSVRPTRPAGLSVTYVSMRGLGGGWPTVHVTAGRSDVLRVLDAYNGGTGNPEEELITHQVV